MIHYLLLCAVLMLTYIYVQDADLLEFRRVRSEQDAEYSESLRVDQEKVGFMFIYSDLLHSTVVCIFRAGLDP